MRTIDELEKILDHAAERFIDVEDWNTAARMIRKAYALGRAEMREIALDACRRNLYVHTPADSYAEEAEGVRRAIVEIMHADDFPEEPKRGVAT